MLKFKKQEKYIIAISDETYDVYYCQKDGVYSILRTYPNFMCPQCKQFQPLLEDVEKYREQFRKELDLTGLIEVKK
jgi:hypothetical protein